MALRRFALSAVALAAVAIALPPAASADHGIPLLDEGLTRYLGIAQTHWAGPAPACVADGGTLIQVHAVLYDDPDRSVAARADQPGCRIWLDRSSWRAMRPVEACTIVVHEWGHMLGLGHVEDPFDLMAEFPARPPRGCAALRRTARTARASRRPARRCAARSKRARRARAKRHHAPRLACVRRVRD